MEEKYKEFTWIPIYKKIVAWLADKQPKQEMLIGTLEAIGITGFNDYDTDDQRIKLNQIDPFTFLSFLNKYGDAKRLDLLRKLAGKIEVENSLIEELKDVNGLPAVNAMKVWLFPYKKERNPTSIDLLWKLFGQARDHDIKDELLNEVFDIKCVGRGNLSICWFYTDPDFYLPLDTRMVAYLTYRNIGKRNYRYDTWGQYVAIRNEATKKLREEWPYVISESAYTHYNIDRIQHIEKDNSIELQTNSMRRKSDLDYIDPDEKTVLSVSGFLQFVNKSSKGNPDSVFYYRGHANIEYKLIPSIYRDARLIENEDVMIKELENELPEEFEHCRCTFDRLVKMQHYELPTRLLDITSNPLVALYFACQSAKKMAENGEPLSQEADGCVFMFDIDQIVFKYSDSDAVSVVSNIARRPHNFDISKMCKLSRKEFNEEDQIGYLLHEIRCCDKSHFVACIDKEDLEKVFFVKPKKSNPRIVKQDGAFFLFGIRMQKKYCLDLGDFIRIPYILKIDADKKGDILKELEKMGINEATLFPEINKMSSFIKNKYSTPKK